jgi:hypothetical protein
MKVDPDRIQELISEQGWYFEPATTNALYFVPPTNQPSRNYATHWTPVTILLPEYMNAAYQETSLKETIYNNEERSHQETSHNKEEGCLIKDNPLFEVTTSLTVEEVQAIERFKAEYASAFQGLIKLGSCP